MELIHTQFIVCKNASQLTHQHIDSIKNRFRSKYFIRNHYILMIYFVSVSFTNNILN